jgi:poly-gamma-glutamate capsule biosynthesis protein CapA/YwtB (metallophosphatase superfamily)
MFHGPMAEYMRANNDPLWGFRPVSAALLEGDVLFGNLETPISRLRRNEPDAPDKYFSPPGIGKALKRLGYDIVNLGHNHIYDFGAEGVETTIRELDEAGLPYIGIGRNADEAARPVIVESPTGLRFGFLGYTTASTALDSKHAYVACFPDLKRVADDVANLKTRVGAVAVSCHTGSQYNPYPAPETRALARTAIESGASVFVAHHAHAPQGWERIGGGIAFYCLSDFVAPVQNEQTRRT